MTEKKIDTKSIENLKVYFNEIKPRLFPFEEHPMGKENLYLKEIYVALLCSISAYDGEISSEETILIKRIINGISLTTSFAQIVKLGIEITPKTVEDFVESFSGKPIAYNFFVDALLLAASEGVIHDKEIELISEIMELLQISPNEAQLIVKLVTSIIENDEKTIKSILSKFKTPSHFNYLLKPNKNSAQLLKTNNRRKYL